METDAAIYGAGRLGSMVLDILRQGGQHRPQVFLDSDSARYGDLVDGLLVEGGMDRVASLLDRRIREVVVAIGDNAARMNVARELRARGMSLISAIHPLVSMARSAWLGQHLIIGPRATICVNARIGAHTIVSAGAIVEHDNVIGEGVFLYPAVRLAGGVTVKDLAVLETGACVIPGRSVGRGARVDAGSVVIRDVPEGGRAGGVPARVLSASRRLSPSELARPRRSNPQNTPIHAVNPQSTQIHAEKEDTC